MVVPILADAGLLPELASVRCPGSGQSTVYPLTLEQARAMSIDEFFRHAAVRNRYFGKALPASTAVEVRRLAHPDWMIEIEATAIV